MSEEIPVVAAVSNREVFRIKATSTPIVKDNPAVDAFMRMAVAMRKVKQEYPAAWRALEEAGVVIFEENIDRVLTEPNCGYADCVPGRRCVRHQYCLSCPNCRPGSPCGCSGPDHKCDVNPEWPDAPREPQQARRTEPCGQCSGSGVRKFAIPCPRCAGDWRPKGTPYPYLVTRDADATQGEQFCVQCGYPEADKRGPQNTVINGFDYGKTRPDGQHERYPTLSEEERAKGFVRPVRQSYAHVGRPFCGKVGIPYEGCEPAPAGKVYACSSRPGHEGECFGAWYTITPEEAAKGVRGGCGGTVTKMGLAIAETYARKPDYYGATFCVGCGNHFPVGEDGEFVWLDGSGQLTTERVGA